MAEIYKLSYTAAQVNALLGKLDQADFDGFEDMYDAVETDKSDVETMIAGARGSIEDATEDAIAEVIATIPSDYTALTVQTNRNTGDIENLYAISQGILYREDTDTDTAYAKSVPAGAAPYASVDKVGGMSAKAKNLYVDGNVSGTQSVRVTLTNPLSAGTYTISAVCTSTDTDSTVCHVSFVGDASEFNFDRGVRYSRTFTLTSEVTQIIFYASQRWALGEGDTFTFTDIQIEKGTTATAYEPHYDGIHHMAVSKVESVGANLWDEEWGTGGLRNDGSINTGITTEIYSQNPIKLINKTFKISTPCRMLGVGLDKDKNSLGWINNAGSFASGQIVTVPDNCVYIRFMTASSGVYGGTYNDNIAVLNATTPTAYHPHIAPDTLNIPSAIKSLTGYGWGISDTCYNYVDFEAGQYVQMVGKRAYQSGDESDTTVLTDMTYTYYPLATPTVTDISGIDNTIHVEPYGSLTFASAEEYTIPTPSKESYIIKLSEVANA